MSIMGMNVYEIKMQNVSETKSWYQDERLMYCEQDSAARKYRRKFASVMTAIVSALFA